jgi:hypothetical protein
MTAAQLAEATPTGTFGGTRLHPVGRDGRPAPRWTRTQQDEHYNDLADAIGAPYRQTTRRAA